MAKQVYLRIQNRSFLKKAEIKHLRGVLEKLGFEIGKVNETGPQSEALPLKCGTHSCDAFEPADGPTRCETEACSTQSCTTHACDTQSCSTEACGSHVCDVHEKSFGSIMSQMTAKNPTFAALSKALEGMREPDGGISLSTLPD